MAASSFLLPFYIATEICQWLCANLALGLGREVSRQDFHLTSGNVSWWWWEPGVGRCRKILVMLALRETGLGENVTALEGKMAAAGALGIPRTRVKSWEWLGWGCMNMGAVKD